MAASEETRALEGLQATAAELARFAEGAGETGHEQVELGSLLKKGGSSDPQVYSAAPYSKLRVPGVGASVEWAPSVQVVDCCPVPRAIRSLYSQIECEMFMGLFPEINRAWITIDNRLFLWNYYKNEDFYVYDGLDQLIVAVGLVRPRPGVFDDGVKYVLVLSTPVEIVLLKLRKGDSVHGDIQLEPTEFNLASDNVPMRSIAGTNDGRIFMAGHDGSLYEFVYENPSMLHSLGLKRQCRKVELSGFPAAKWLIPSFVRNLAGASDPLVKVVVDQERKLLYTLSSKSALTMYRLSANRGDDSGISMKKRLDPISSAVAAYLHRLNNNRTGLGEQHARDMRVVSLDVVKKGESEVVHLVAITHRGVRIYLTTRANDRDGTCLDVFYVRGPPSKMGGAGSASTASQRSTSLLKELNSAYVNGEDQASSEGVLPCSGTEAVVGCGMYSGGVTLLSFAPTFPLDGSYAGGNVGAAQRNQPDQSRQQQHVLSAFSLDSAMRKQRSSADNATGLSPAFPPLRWQQEPFHEVIDSDVLEHGPALRQSLVEGDATALSASGLRSSQKLPVGRVWAMVEATFDPSTSNEQEMVFAHMLYTPTPLATENTPQASNAIADRAGPSAPTSSTVAGTKRSASDMQAGSSSQGAGTMGACNENKPAPLTELAQQHMLPRRYYLVLTSHGLWVLVKNRPINQLYALLQGPDPGSNADIEEFFKQYGLDESCAMCLAIASKTGSRQNDDSAAAGASNALVSPFTDNSVSDDAAQSQWVARRAAIWFRRVGYGIANLDPGANSIPQHLPMYRSQVTTETQRALTQGGASTTIVHSGCFSGLSLHVSRLLRPIWNWTVLIGMTASFNESGDPPVQRCRWKPEQIAMLVRPLIRLKSFMVSQAPFADAIREFEQSGAGTAGAVSYPGGREMAPDRTSFFQNSQSGRRFGFPSPPSPLAVENAKVVALYRLVDRSIQALLLFDYLQAQGPQGTSFSSLVPLVSVEIRQLLHTMTWGQLITTQNGKMSACSLVKVLVEKSPAHVSRELVARLEEHCPAFFSPGDALQISAFEEITLAEKSMRSSSDRSRHLKVALDRLREGFKKSSSGSGGAGLAQFSFVRSTLTDACEKFESLGQADSAIEIALFCAECFALQPLDVLPARPTVGPGPGAGAPQSNSLSLVPSGNLSSQPSQAGSAQQAAQGREATALRLRQFCYDLALQILSRGGSEQPGGVSSAGSAGPGAVTITKSVAGSQDALWHYTLYSWLLERGLTSVLLNIDSPYIVSFLGDAQANDPRKAATGVYPAELHAEIHLKLQAEWYSRHDQQLRAAEVYRYMAKLDVQQLATLSGSTVNSQAPSLKQRIAYLSLAVNASNSNESNGSLDAVRDELELANLQARVLEALTNSLPKAEDRATRECAVKELTTALLGPSDLYNDYAYRFELWEACIDIMMTCDHKDPEELQTLYINVFRQTDRPYRNSPIAQHISVLKLKLEELIDRFVPADKSKGLHFFPLDFIVQGLEDLTTFLPAHQMNHASILGPRKWNSWVLDTMFERGISRELLFKAYNNYMETQEHAPQPLGLSFISEDEDANSEWYNDLSKFHVAEAIVSLIRRWHAEAEQMKSAHVLRNASVSDLLVKLRSHIGSLHGDEISVSGRSELLKGLDDLTENSH